MSCLSKGKQTSSEQQPLAYCLRPQPLLTAAKLPSGFQKFHLLCLIQHFVFMLCACAHVTTRGRGTCAWQLWGVSSFLPLCEAWGSSGGHELRSRHLHLNRLERRGGGGLWTGKSGTLSLYSQKSIMVTEHQDLLPSSSVRVDCEPAMSLSEISQLGSRKVHF